MPRPPVASLPGNGERGLKLPTPARYRPNWHASLPGNGERGLKHLPRHPAHRSDLASLPGNGERGLKLAYLAHGRGIEARIAPRQRGAWIETGDNYRRWNRGGGIAPRQRGAWIETARYRRATGGFGLQGIAPRQRGAWIETSQGARQYRANDTGSLPGNGERGLKRAQGRGGRHQLRLRSPATGSVD